MLWFVYGIICLGSAGVSFLSLMDQKVINHLATRGITLSVLILSWLEPLSITSRQFERDLGWPAAVWFLGPVLLLAPFLTTSATIFTGPLGLFDRLRARLGRRFAAAQSLEPYPDAFKAEQVFDWDRAFAIYRDRYLPRDYDTRIIWNRLLSVCRKWNDAEKSLSALQSMAKTAPSERVRLTYVLESADLLSTGLGSSGRAMTLLKASLPTFSDPKHREQITKRMTAACTTAMIQAQRSAAPSAP